MNIYLAILVVLVAAVFACNYYIKYCIRTELSNIKRRVKHKTRQPTEKKEDESYESHQDNEPQPMDNIIIDDVEHDADSYMDPLNNYASAVDGPMAFQSGSRQDNILMRDIADSNYNQNCQTGSCRR
jgi:hypothetical protein